MIEQSEIPIANLCKDLPISRPTFYRLKENQNPQDPDRKLRSKIHKIVEEFPFYGYRRVTKELENRRITINHKKVLRIMKEENLICRRKKKFKPVTTQSDHGYKTYPNLAKGLEVTGLNQLWVSDITYIQLLREIVYLAVIIDIFSRKCVGWFLSRDIDTQLTLGALNRAIATRKQFGFDKLIHHSDLGVQYAAEDYVKSLVKIGARISMSRKGNVYDNAFAESFMKTLKVEEVYLKEYETLEEAHKNIEEFIEKVYNKKRLHSSIGYLSPNKFEKEVLKRSKN